jgi:glucose-6-phosphate 1-dehydrogenase
MQVVAAGAWRCGGRSATRTPRSVFVLRLDVDNLRWVGVPFYIRTGKRLPVTQTEFRLIFKRPPGLGLGLPDLRRPEADAPGPEAITLDMEFAQEGGEGPTPYEVLLHAALTGNSTRFQRQDGVEETWRIMQPLITDPPPVQRYAPGTWGPTGADALVAGHGGWREPW